VTIRVTGEAALRAALAKYGATAEAEISQAIRATALNVQGDAVKSIQRGTKTGRVYMKSAKGTKSKTRHQASAPGEAPASDTGKLAGSVVALINPLVAFVGSDLKYATYLEFGTMNISERPWLRPAREKNMQVFRQRIANALKKSAQKVTK
jgi:HK97 gp10 family phage protein